MYKSPIEKIYGELQTQMVQEDEKLVMKAIREVGINVDKSELIKALQYDRNQYTKGYEDGKNEVLDKIRAEIANHLQIMDVCDVKKVNGVIVQTELVNRKVVLYDSVMRIIDKYKAESE